MREIEISVDVRGLEPEEQAILVMAINETISEFVEYLGVKEIVNEGVCS